MSVKRTPPKNENRGGREDTPRGLPAYRPIYIGGHHIPLDAEKKGATIAKMFAPFPRRRNEMRTKLTVWLGPEASQLRDSAGLLTQTWEVAGLRLKNPGP